MERLTSRLARAQARITALDARDLHLSVENEQMSAALRSAEEALERYADLYDHAPIAYTTLDRLGVIREINLAGCALFGVVRSRILGKPFRVLVPVTDRALLVGHLRSCRRTGGAVTQMHVDHPGRGPVAVELLSRRCPGPRECYATAISDRTEQEEAARQHRDMLVAAKVNEKNNAAKDQLIATINHELRAPLAPMTAAVNVLDGDRDIGGSKELSAAVDIIRRNVHIQTRLLDDLLDATGVVRGKTGVARTPMDLHGVVREALEMLAGEIAGKHLDVTVTLEAELSTLEGDPVRLRQMFWNLGRNAVKFSARKGHLWIASWNSAGRILVEVADEGRGIPPEALSLLFEPFTQVHEGEQGTLGGLGLGLSICRGIAVQHGGSVSVASPGPGRGARFVVDLPVTPAPMARREPPASAPARPGARILVVDDNRDMAQALAMALRRYGYAVQLAGAADEALALDPATFDLLISDVRLSDRSGHDLLRNLRRRAPLPAIALSASGSAREVSASADAGFVTHLTKPIEIPSLVAEIERALARQ